MKLGLTIFPTDTSIPPAELAAAARERGFESLWHVGGGWPHAARRALEYGDGWAPIHGFGDLVGKLPEFRSRARDAGRDPEGLEITIFGLPPKAAAIEPYRAAGAARGVFFLPAAPRDEVLPLLDRYAAVARELAG